MTLNFWEFGAAASNHEGKQIILSVCLCVFVSVCVNEIPTLIFYVRTLSDGGH
jgi:hypothetical protein